MNDHDPDLPADIHALKAMAAEGAEQYLRPRASTVDAEGVWPAHAMEALARAGLMGLNVSPEAGGRGQGLLALAVVTEELAAVCPSSAMCFGMHCLASKVIGIKATAEQAARYLRPIAEGRHVTSLALSEPGTGSHFYLPRTTFDAGPDGFVLHGAKSFVTSGGHADSYVISAVASGGEFDPGTFSCFVVDGAGPGMEWQEPWSGFGMRGNSARGLKLDGAVIPSDNLLGSEGDEIWYVFDVIAPYFLVAMSGVYIGIARAAFDEAVSHLKDRRLEHTGRNLAESPVLAGEVAEAWIAVNRSRRLLHHAATLGDAGAAGAREAILASKVDVAEMVVGVTNAAMSLTGGRSYQANGKLAQLLRDARAAPVMSPTTHLLKAWLGRSLLGLPLL
ncbi:MAG TPA: acyl-CoA dehydrogenase family protein [Arenibaculum sp.]|nr:acyl-CoA dehydrogenase family protein [Arenibaculum sp.]